MASSLILHAGMHKTGTSSIQKTLFHGLQDTRYHYVGCGLVNGSRAIHTLVADQPVLHHTHRDRGLDDKAVEQLRIHYQQKWNQQLELARESAATPIVSAEECWLLSASELQKLRTMIELAGYRAHVVVYLRSPLSWMSSMIQELLKSTLSPLVDAWLSTAPPAWGQLPHLQPMYSERLALFRDIFGADALTVRHFNLATLSGGCVVLDFCRFIGLAIEPQAVLRSNDSMALDASRFLYVYNRFTRNRSKVSYFAHQARLHRLQSTPGSPLKLHPKALASIQSVLHRQVAEIRADYGIDLSEKRPTTEANLVTSTEDLLQFSSASLDWLAGAVGCQPVQPGQDSTAQQVAEQMRILGYACGSGIDRLHAMASRLLWKWRYRRWA
ncbi:MAG: hypothetical protein VKN13_02125 [Cyanobacteriota bacterium]|nr:hypothetical protein [Cyanobacteriota bacterium]